MHNLTLIFEERKLCLEKPILLIQVEVNGLLDIISFPSLVYDIREKGIKSRSVVAWLDSC